MVHQRDKDVALTLCGPLFRLNYWRLRWRRWPQPLRLHLGCGPDYWPGFINIDMNLRRRIDLWLDIRLGLPFPDNSVEFIYAGEVFEHFYPDELNVVLGECFRVLRPDTSLRVVVPDLEAAVAAYRNSQLDWFGDWPRSYRSAGGRLANFLFCDGQHKNALDQAYLEELLLDQGFWHVQRLAAGESRASLPSLTFLAEREKSSSRLLHVEALKRARQATNPKPRQGVS